MHRFIVITVFMLLASQAEAHSHPAADALPHALEHLLFSAQSWRPYLAGLCIAALLAALSVVLRGRRSAK